jgi:hypothetical protein
MIASSGYVQAECHVLGSSMAIASQTGVTATCSFDPEYGLSQVEVSEHGWEEGEQGYAIAEDEDGINPDDAPELLCDDEVRDPASSLRYGAYPDSNKWRFQDQIAATNMIGTLGQPQTSAEVSPEACSFQIKHHTSVIRSSISNSRR